MDRVFIIGPGDRVSIPGQVIPKAKKKCYGQLCHTEYGEPYDWKQ